MRLPVRTPKRSVFLSGYSELVGIPGGGKTTLALDRGWLAPKPSLRCRMVHRLPGTSRYALLTYDRNRFLTAHPSLRDFIYSRHGNPSDVTTKISRALRDFAGLQYLYKARQGPMVIDDGWLQRLALADALFRFDSGASATNWATVLSGNPTPSTVLVVSTTPDAAIERMHQRGRIPSVLASFSSVSLERVLILMDTSVQHLTTYLSQTGSKILSCRLEA